MFSFAFRLRRPTSRVRLRSSNPLLAAGVAALLLASSVSAQNPTPPFEFAQEYFVPIDSESLRTFSQSINTQDLGGGDADTVRTVVSLTALQAETVVVIDHWEDGLEADLSNPTQSTTEIFGDRFAANGAAPGVVNDVDDVINSDTFIVLENDVPANPRLVDPANPTAGEILYDGRDRIGVTKVMAVTRAGWRLQESTLLAGAVEVFPTYTWGSEFEIPAGQDQYAGCDVLAPDRIFATGPDICMFQYASGSITASELGATVAVDYDGNGTNDFTQTLAPGESALFSNLLTGTRIVSTDPIQLHLLTGDVGSNYEARWFNIVPRPQWSDEYYSAVGSASAGQPTQVILYNPGAGAIDVDVRAREFSTTGSDDVFQSADTAITDDDCPAFQTVTFPAITGLTDSITDVDLGIRITGTYRGDIDLDLISPDGTRVLMSVWPMTASSPQCRNRVLILAGWTNSCGAWLSCRVFVKA